MAYYQKNNIFNKSCTSCKSSPFLINKLVDSEEVYENIDWDNLTPQQKKDMNMLPEVEAALYGFDVTRYKNYLENINTTMFPGHIQASLSNPQSKKVQEDLGIEPGEKSYVNPWYTGNRPIHPDTKLKEGENYKETKEFETQRIYLTKDQAKEFIEVAKTIKPTKNPGTFEIGGKTYAIPLGDEGYDFIKNNCAKGTCEAFGIDPSKAKRKSQLKVLGGVGGPIGHLGGLVLDTLINRVMSDEGITEPIKAWDLIMKKFGIKKK